MELPLVLLLSQFKDVLTQMLFQRRLRLIDAVRFDLKKMRLGSQESAAVPDIDGSFPFVSCEHSDIYSTVPQSRDRFLDAFLNFVSYRCCTYQLEIEFNLRSDIFESPQAVC